MSRHLLAAPSRFLTLLAVCGSVTWATAADRPPAQKLFPADTVAFAQVAHAQELKESFLKTSLGRIAQDPQVSPLVKDLYGSSLDLLKNVEDQLGLSIPEVLNIFQGEIAIGITAKDSRPNVTILLDVGKELNTAQKLLDRGLEFAKSRDVEITDETVEGVKFTTVTPQGRRRNQAMTFFEKDGTIAIGSSADQLKQVLSLWTGGKGETLSGNNQFAAIEHKCRGTKDHPAQLMFYVDPIELVKGVAGDNAGARIGLALLPTLGLDGLKGVGGSITMAAGEFDSILHLHLLLDNPRAGVVELLALTDGDTAPERWIPGDVQSYTTFYWDLEKTYTKLGKLVDSFQYPGALAEMVKSRVSGTLGIDFEEELLPALGGRFSMASWIDKPATDPGAQGNVVAVKLKDQAAFEKTFQKIVEKYSERFEKKSFAGTTYYRVDLPAFGPRPQENPPEPCVALLDGYALIVDRPKFLHKILQDKDDPSKSLAQSLEFKLIASKISRQSATKPGFVTFHRPEEGMRMIYDLASNQQMRERMRNRGENNPLFRSVDQALEKNPLPPFAVIAKYLAPGGGLIVNDETGFHYTSFTLKRE